MRLLMLSILGPALLVAAIRAEGEGGVRRVDFDDQRAGDSPRGFSCGLTGRGRPGVWRVVRDETSVSRPNVLAQTDPDATSYRFPVCVLDAVTTTDVDVSVRFKPIRGVKDQAAGIVWRYRDASPSRSTPAAPLFRPASTCSGRRWGSAIRCWRS